MVKSLIKLEKDEFFIAPFNVEAIEGHEEKKNFPFCCPYHSQQFKDLSSWFENFPDCCDGHRKYINSWWFRKSTYDCLPLKIMKEVSYTEYHVLNKINNDDWYKDITDFIDFCCHSFGTPAVGLDRYLQGLEFALEHISKSQARIPKEKIKKLESFLKKLNSPPTNQVDTDINILIDIYNRWLTCFPFEIEYFKNLKVEFENTIPFINGPSEYNRYLKIYTSKIHTQESLVETLTGITKKLLGLIESGEFVKALSSQTLKEHQISLINKTHQLKQITVLSDFTKGELLYIKALKKWLKNEKEYFKEIATLYSASKKEIETSVKIEITDEIKPLAAALLKLKIGYFLQTEEYDLHLLENKFEKYWAAAINEVNDSDIIYIGNTRVHDDAFCFILSKLHQKNRDLFFNFIEITLIGFIDFAKDRDFNSVIRYLEELEAPSTILEKLKNKVATIRIEEMTSQSKGKIFIGHGRSPQWKFLESHLKEENIEVVSFESKSRTGKHVVDILKEMLNEATIAIIVMTAEDETIENNLRARQNVIHEIGLFQGKLGFENVVILKQHGIEEFSNVSGLQYIPFHDNIEQAYHQLRLYLKEKKLMT